MCTINNDINRLNRLRAKGHKLKKGYKYLYIGRTNLFWHVCSDVFSEYIWTRGWNQARYLDGSCLRRKTPYPENGFINESFHVYVTRQGIINREDLCCDEEMDGIIPVYFYCDEATGYQSDGYGLGSHIITVSRLLVKSPKIQKTSC